MPLSLPDTRWIQNPPRPASIWHRGLNCWVLSVCPTTLSLPMPGRRSWRTSCSCKSGSGLLLTCLIGCTRKRTLMGMLSTATSSTTRKWCLELKPHKAPDMAAITPLPPAPALTWGSCWQRPSRILMGSTWRPKPSRLMRKRNRKPSPPTRGSKTSPIPL